MKHFIVDIKQINFKGVFFLNGNIFLYLKLAIVKILQIDCLIHISY